MKAIHFNFQVLIMLRIKRFQSNLSIESGLRLKRQLALYTHTHTRTHLHLYKRAHMHR